MADGDTRDESRPITYRQADESPERDLAGALHEVSNALTVVLGWIEGARESADGTPVGKSLDVAIARARLAHRIVRRAIGAAVDGDEARSAAAVARDAALGLEPEAGRAGLRITTSLDPMLDRAILSAPGTVLQILTNLLLNAIAASPNGAAIAIEGRLAGDRVVLCVSDEGPGVPAARRAGLFSEGVSTREGGAGIGLRHAAALARAGGGELALVDAPRGARFEIAWPCRVAPPSEVEIATPRVRVDLGGTRVLVVEDDAAVVDLLETALGARGADVVVARKREEIAAALASGPFDAALLDLSPIHLDVAGALHAVRASSPGARLIVISGSAHDLPAMPRDLHPTWIRKPFEIAEIVRALASR